MDDPMLDIENWGWQATAASMRERTSYLWKNTPIPFNVTFEVGPEGQRELIRAHRDILAISSEVFYSMFYGPMTKPRGANDPIVDDDIDPEAFRLMLKFIYTESIDPKSERELEHRERQIGPFPTGVELAFKTMQAAGKYGIPALYLFCRSYILDDIQKAFKTSEGAAECGLLYALYARNPEWHNKRIIEAVWREIDAFTKAVLKVPDEVLQTVDEMLMVEFLSRTALNVSREVMLYDFAIRWARLQQEGPRKDETLKDVMENLCKVLRFSSMTEQEWLDGPVKDRVYTVNELKGNIAMVDDTIDRRAHDPPAVIRFEIFEAKEIHEAVWERDDNVGQLEIQTQTEDNPVLSKLVEKCIRKQMERNDTDCIFDLSINFLYKNRDLCWDGLLDSYEMRLNREELEMVRNRGRKVAQMKLGLGDVAVGFTVVSKRGGVLTNKLDSMFLLFGEESVKQYSKHRHNSSELRRLFYLGRLTTGQYFLDSWAGKPHKYPILYEVTYGKKTLDAPAKEKDHLPDVDSDILIEPECLISLFS